MKEHPFSRFSKCSSANTITDLSISLCFLWATFSFIDAFIFSKTFREKLLIQFSNIRV
ncbi:hypothetical protein [Flavobacterium sp. NRK F7]|uniref:hypothetical protein n=1 Tax=Flavobacterium sp. NRK F7 TaxID=2954930 RepID=UPI002090D6F4|nr:hypothetical protein [Flavobacterium sp. NRK F7]MCO6163464.1 hypothetical protein [Flavobacterium sp. NRK F7]